MSGETYNWSENYKEFTQRNIGIITEKQQQILKKSKVCLLGVGGVGSPAFEVLVRTGIGKFCIVDKDKFDLSNMNRQIYAFHETCGKYKVDVALEYAKKINPEVEIKTYRTVSEENISEILTDTDVVVLAIDELKPCLISSRKARELNIPLVEGWAIPYGNVRVFTSNTPELEDAYNLPTKGCEISDFSDDELTRLGTEVLFSLGNIEGIVDFYSDETIEKIAQGHITSFAPMVWLTSVLLATEALKILLNWGNFAEGPDFTLYDPFGHRIPNKAQDQNKISHSQSG